MDLSNHFEAIVENLVNQIHSQVQDKAQSNVDSFLETKLAEYDFESKVAEIVQRQAVKKVASYDFDTRQIQTLLSNAGATAVANLKEDIKQQVMSDIDEQLKQTDIKALIREQINEVIDQRIRTANFPDRTIPHESIDFDGIVISGDVIRGGIIQEFGSTGIDDKATKCQVTIMDTHLVVEAPLITTGLDVRGDVSLTGNLNLNGEFNVTSPGYSKLLSDTTIAVQESLNKELFLEYSNLVTENIQNRGIDFKEVLIDGQLVLAKEKLGPGVIHSNLRRVGELTELQVSGETFLSQTLYSANKRVGINTIEPTAALSVWDEDVEVLVGKKSQGRAFIGTNRQTAITLGANAKENISLEPDGSVTINDLRLGALPLSTASNEPNWEGRAGEIVFNDSPAVGKPIGWVCLQGHRWAKFGIIQE